jgi:hypothetical protein
MILVEGTSDRSRSRRSPRGSGSSGPRSSCSAARTRSPTTSRSHRATPPRRPLRRERGALFRRYLEEVFVCEPDLEGELIRALGTDKALALADPSFATLQKQPEYRDQPLETQLRRYLSGRSGNKLRYARLFVEALDLTQIPAPLQGVIGYR